MVITNQQAPSHKLGLLNILNQQGCLRWTDSPGCLRWTDSPRIKTLPQASWEGVQLRDFLWRARLGEKRGGERRFPLSSLLRFSESVLNGYLASPHAHITTPSSRQPKNHLRTVTATVQGDFVCVENVQAGAHLSTGGNGDWVRESR